LALKREGKSVSFSKVKINLAEFAADGTNKTVEYKLSQTSSSKRKKTGAEKDREAVLTVQFKAEWLKVNDKKLVRKNSLIQIANQRVASPQRAPQKVISPPASPLVSFASSEYDLVTDSEAEYSDSEADLTGDATESDLSGSDSEVDEESDERIGRSKEGALKKECAQLRQRERQLSVLLDKAKKDLESKEQQIFQLKIELEKEKERNRRINSVATIMSSLGIPISDDADGRTTKSLSNSAPAQQLQGHTSVDEEKSESAEREKREKEMQELRQGIVELKELLDKKELEIVSINETLEGNEKAMREKERQIKQLKKDAEKEKVLRIELQINKEKERLGDVERAIKDKNEIKRIREELRKASEALEANQAAWNTKEQQYQHEIKSLSKTIENFGRTKW